MKKYNFAVDVNQSDRLVDKGVVAAVQVEEVITLAKQIEGFRQIRIAAENFRALPGIFSGDLVEQTNRALDEWRKRQDALSDSLEEGWDANGEDACKRLQKVVANIGGQQLLHAAQYLQSLQHAANQQRLLLRQAEQQINDEHNKLLIELVQKLNVDPATFCEGSRFDYVLVEAIAAAILSEDLRVRLAPMLCFFWVKPGALTDDEVAVLGRSGGVATRGLELYGVKLGKHSAEFEIINTSLSDVIAVAQLSCVSNMFTRPWKD